jgi:hypothetical protein
MATRTEIHAELERALAEHEADVRSLTPEQVERRCTGSEVPGGAPWPPKDHIAHLIAFRRSYEELLSSRRLAVSSGAAGRDPG